MKKINLFIQFLIFGIVFGIAEDVIAIKFATGDPITVRVFVIVVLVTIPFAIIGELIVDRRDVFAFFKKRIGKKLGKS